jgi:hypothetical protein
MVCFLPGLAIITYRQSGVYFSVFYLYPPAALFKEKRGLTPPLKHPQIKESKKVSPLRAGGWEDKLTLKSRPDPTFSPHPKMA